MKKLIKSLLVLTLLLTTTMALAAPPAIPGAGFGDISNTGNNSGTTDNESDEPPQMIQRTVEAPSNNQPDITSPTVTGPTVTQQPIYQQPIYQQPMQGFPMGGIQTNSIQPRTITKSGPESFLALAPVAAYAFLQRRKRFNQ